MKHIKTYESNNNKIYLVVKTNTTEIPYYIFTIDNEKHITYSDDKKFTHIKYSKYSYVADGIRLISSPNNGETKIGVSRNSTLSKILYRTNDYNDAKYQLDVILTANTYNL